MVDVLGGIRAGGAVDEGKGQHGQEKYIAHSLEARKKHFSILELNNLDYTKMLWSFV